MKNRANSVLIPAQKACNLNPRRRYGSIGQTWNRQAILAKQKGVQ